MGGEGEEGLIKEVQIRKQPWVVLEENQAQRKTGRKWVTDSGKGGVVERSPLSEDHVNSWGWDRHLVVVSHCL